MYRRAAGALAVTLMVLLGASSPARADMRPTVDNASPSRAAGAQTVYAIAFTTERRLGRGTSSPITLAFPAGSGFAGYGGSAVFDTDVSTTRSIGACAGARTLTVSCGLDLDQAIPAGHHVRVVLNGITNPPAGTPCVTVSTSSPTQAAVPSAPFSVVAANPVSAVTADNSTPTRAAGGRTVYAVGFTTSRTGGISRAANSAVELVFPAGTTFAGYGGGAVYDTDVSTTTSIGACGGVATLTVVCGLDVEQAIPASHHVVVVLNGIANPPAGSSHVAVATSSDHGLVDSASYGVLPAQAVSGVSVALGSRAVSALTQYTVEFVTSAGGGLSRDANSAISVVFPAGTSFGSYGGSAVYDVTAGGPAIGSCGGGVALTVTCGLSLGQSVPAGHRVRVTFAGVGNPSTAGGRTVNVSTTSDLGADSAPYSIAAAAAPPDTTVTGGPSGTVSGNTTTFTFASTV